MVFENDCDMNIFVKSHDLNIEDRKYYILSANICHSFCVQNLNCRFKTVYDKYCRIGTHTFLKTLFQILTDLLRI